MTLNQIIGQHMIIGISGAVLTETEINFIVENNVGGIILFTRNCESPEQIYDLCAHIHSLREKMPDKAPIFIGIDMEGGRVHRLKPPFTQWPAVSHLGKIDNPTATFHFSNKMGLELASVGINLNFAPCVDVLSNPKNKVIGDRAVSSNPELVAKHASALVRGYLKSGVMSCVKHFPGHGNTLIDSHEDLPRESADRQHLDSMELIPFKKAFRARVDLAMTSHILFEKIDNKYPVTLSPYFIKKVMREDLRYRGLVVSDDLDMGALIKNYSREEIPVLALAAGVDILLYCNDPESPSIAIDSITQAIAQGTLNKTDLENGYKQIIKVKQDNLAEFKMPSLNEANTIIGNPHHLELAAAIAKDQVPPNLTET